MLILDKFHRVLRSRVRAMGGRILTHTLEGYDVQSYELEGRGNGPPIVLLHGLGGSANSFYAIISRLRATWSRIYVPDLPGHGFSDLRPGSAPLDVEGHQRLFSAYLDHVVRDPAVLVGNSMGGAIVLHTATERPKTPAVALFAPAGAPMGESGMDSIRSVFSATSRRDALAFLNRLTHAKPLVNHLIASDMREHLGAAPVRHVIANIATQRQLDEAAVRALTMPVLLVWGGSEKILPADGIDFFRRTLPSHARIEVMERCGHLPMMEQPRRTVALLDELARAIRPN